MGLLDGSYSICKQSAPRSRQITTLTPHHSIYTTTYLHKIYTGRMLFLTPNQQCQSTKGRQTQTHTRLTALGPGLYPGEPVPER